MQELDEENSNPYVNEKVIKNILEIFDQEKMYALDAMCNLVATMVCVSVIALKTKGEMVQLISMLIDAIPADEFFQGDVGTE